MKIHLSIVPPSPSRERGKGDKKKGPALLNYPLQFESNLLYEFVRGTITSKVPLW